MGGTLIGSIGWGISALVTLIIVSRLIKAYQKEKENTFKYLIGFIGFRFLLFISIALAPVIYLMTKNLLMTGVFITLLYVFMFLSFLFPPLLFSSFRWQKLKNYYFGLMLIIVFTGIAVAVRNFVPATYIPAIGAVFQPAPKILPNALYPFGKILSVAPLTILFLIYAFKGTGKIRLRSLLMGLGLFWVLTTIIVPTLIPFPWAGMYCCIGDILIFAGVMIRIPKPEEASKV